MSITTYTYESSSTGYIPVNCVIDAMIAIAEIRRCVSAPDNKDLSILIEKLKALGVHDKKYFIMDRFAQKNIRGFFRELFHGTASLEAFKTTNTEIFSLVTNEYANLQRIANGSKDADFTMAQDFCVKLCRPLGKAEAIANTQKKFAVILIDCFNGGVNMNTTIKFCFFY